MDITPNPMIYDHWLYGEQEEVFDRKCAERAVVAELAAYMLVDADRNFVVLSL